VKHDVARDEIEVAIRKLRILAQALGEVHTESALYGTQVRVADLRRGDVTIVRAVRSGGKLVAVEVESRFNFDRRESLVGFVTDFEGPDRIRIAGQASDIAGVTDATFVGRRAGLRNGGWVLVQGTLQRGTMLAWKLVILEE
jgi:hypothetical protein